MNNYHFLDCTIEADLLLPELPVATVVDNQVVTVAAGKPDIHYDEEVHEWESDGVKEMSCDRSGDWFRLTLSNELAVHIDLAHNQVLYEADVGIDLSTLRHFLVDQALPRLIGQSGGLVLHGGCVSNGTSTIAFLGATGSGKSTLCASFAKDGWQVLSDDCLLLEAAEMPSVRGAYSGVRLYPETIERLDLQDSATRPMSADSDKKRICTQAGTEPGRRSLDLIVSLGEGDVITLEPRNGASALMDLVACSFNLAPGDTTLATSKVQQFATVLGSGLPVLLCCYPREYDDLARVRQCIVDALGTAR